ncbi:unnamed protein product [Hymenolepis diminuta]|uniref:Uncharacterized protein n=1 Tax=Hymenolepis diminuta TaxID=6216 RepID=A0A564Z0L7_HYMDI|nr:unnamed protein product [Hymenolepis diminuta]
MNLDRNCNSGMNQQLIGVHSHVNRIERISNENVLQNVSSHCKSLDEQWLCSELQFTQFHPFKSHICDLCGKRGIRKQCQMKTESRKFKPEKSPKFQSVNSTNKVNGANKRK